jgi:hypothetical protein
VSKPPPGVLLAYRFFGWRVGPAYREWVHDDITRNGWIVRQGAPALAAVLLVGAGVAAAVNGDTGRIGTLVFVVGAICLFLRRSLQERALRQQGIDASGIPLKEAPWYTDEQARRRRNVLGTVGTVLLVVTAMTILALRSAP